MSMRVRTRGNRRRGDNANLVRTRGARRYTGEPVFTTIDWIRDLRLVGEVEPNGSMTDWDRSWALHSTGYLAASIPAGAAYDSEKMAPLRYELGQLPVEESPYRYFDIRYGSTAKGASLFPPPLTGHLAKSKVSEITIPGAMFILDTATYENTGITTIGTASRINAYELFVNGISVQLDSVSIAAVFRSPGVYASPSYTMTLTDPVTLEPDDVVELDVYTTFSIDPPVAPTVERRGMYMSPAAANITFDGTQIIRNTSALNRYKITFSDDGPSGLSELRLETQIGWTITQTETQITATHIATGDYVLFDWGREIPYVELRYAALDNAPVSGLTVVRYYPADSGDYEAILSRDNLYGGPSPPVGTTSNTYGVWDTSAPTTFTHIHRRVLTPVFLWQAPPQIPSAYVANFPSTVSIVPL